MISFDQARRGSLSALLFLLLLAFSIHQIVDPDIWWHLKTGQHILAQFQLPQQDLYSFTVTDHRWIDLHWGFQVLVYLSYALGGNEGITLFQALLLLASFWTLFRFGERERIGLTVAVLLLVLLTSNERFVERPHLFSFLFLSLYLRILHQYKHHNSKGIYLLPFLQVFWSNTSGVFVLGLIVVGAYLIGEGLVLKLKLPFQWNAVAPLDTKRYHRLLLVGGATFLAPFVNPYGVEGVLFPMKLFTRITGDLPVFSLTIGEFLPPLSSFAPTTSLISYQILIGLGAISFLLNYARLSLSHYTIFCVFLYLSFLARRNVAEFAIVAAPIILVNFQESLPRALGYLKARRFIFPGRVLKSISNGVLIGTMLVFLVSVVSDRYYIDNRDPKRFGFGIARSQFPEKAVDFFLERRIAGNLFNDINVGGYLIWRLPPDRKVFIDGRLEVYDAAFYALYLGAAHDLAAWKAVSERYHLNVILLNHTGWASRFISRLLRDPSWALIYFDDVAAVILKNTPENRIFLQESPWSADKKRQESLAAANNGGLLADLRNLCRRLAGVPVEVDDAYRFFSLGNFYALAGKHDEAIEHLHKALELYPNFAFAQANLGIIYYREGRYQEAVSALQGARRLDSRTQPEATLGEIYLVTGRYEEARNEFSEAIRAAPRSFLLYYKLGVCEVRMERKEDAVRSFREAIRLKPDHVESLRELAGVYNQMGLYKLAEEIHEQIMALELINPVRKK